MFFFINNFNTNINNEDSSKQIYTISVIFSNLSKDNERKLLSASCTELYLCHKEEQRRVKDFQIGKESVISSKGSNDTMQI